MQPGHLLHLADSRANTQTPQRDVSGDLCASTSKPAALHAAIVALKIESKVVVTVDRVIVRRCESLIQNDSSCTLVATRWHDGALHVQPAATVAPAAVVALITSTHTSAKRQSTMQRSIRQLFCAQSKILQPTISAPARCKPTFFFHQKPFAKFAGENVRSPRADPQWKLAPA